MMPPDCKYLPPGIAPCFALSLWNVLLISYSKLFYKQGWAIKAREEGKSSQSIPWQLAYGQLNRREDFWEVFIMALSSYKVQPRPSTALGWPPCCLHADSGFEFMLLMYDISADTRQNDVPNNKEIFYSV